MHIVAERLGDTPKYQTDSHTRAEQHGKPGHKVKLRFVFRAAQFGSANGTEHQVTHGEKDHRQDNGESPAEVLGDDQLNEAEKFSRRFGKQGGEENKDQHSRNRQ